jgi:hypothetical protein
MLNNFILDTRKRCMVNFTLRPLYLCEKELRKPSGEETVGPRAGKEIWLFLSILETLSSKLNVARSLTVLSKLIIRIQNILPLSGHELYQLKLITRMELKTGGINRRLS